MNPQGLLRLGAEEKAQSKLRKKGKRGFQMVGNRRPVTLEEIKNARLHVIYIIDVDAVATREVEPEAYSQRTESFLTLA